VKWHNEFIIWERKLKESKLAKDRIGSKRWWRMQLLRTRGHDIDTCCSLGKNENQSSES